MRLQGVYKSTPEPYMPEKPEKPIIMENKGGGELIIQNPSVLSKSEYKLNPKPFLENSGNKVLLIDAASDHDLQQAVRRRRLV